MDSITQGLLGAVTAQLGFRQKLGRDATWVAAGAAILPDLDIFVTPFLSLTGAEVDEMTSLVIHRGLSHSLLATPILSLPIAALWWWFRTHRNRRQDNSSSTIAERPNSFGLLYACVFLALLSAPLLDWCTSYGTQLLAPITNTRYALHCLPIVDVFYTPLLILTLLSCYLTRKLSRRRAAIRATLILGWVGFLLSIGYIVTGYLMHDWAVEQACQAARSLTKDSEEKILRADAYPALGSVFLWRTVVETEDQWLTLRAHRFSRQPPSQWPGESAEKMDDPWIEKARQLPEVQRYDWFTSGTVRATSSHKNGRHVVEFHDMRYGMPLENTESLWPLTVLFHDSGDVLYIDRQRRRPRGRFGQLVRQVWSDIWNP